MIAFTLSNATGSTIAKEDVVNCVPICGSIRLSAQVLFSNPAQAAAVKTIQDQLTAQPEPRQPGMVPIRGTDANAAAA